MVTENHTRKRARGENASGVLGTRRESEKKTSLNTLSRRRRQGAKTPLSPKKWKVDRDREEIGILKISQPGWGAIGRRRQSGGFPGRGVHYVEKEGATGCKKVIEGQTGAPAISFSQNKGGAANQKRGLDRGGDRFWGKRAAHP